MEWIFLLEWPYILILVGETSSLSWMADAHHGTSPRLRSLIREQCCTWLPTTTTTLLSPPPHLILTYSAQVNPASIQQHLESFWLWSFNIFKKIFIFWHYLTFGTTFKPSIPQHPRTPHCVELLCGNFSAMWKYTILLYPEFSLSSVYIFLRFALHKSFVWHYISYSSYKLVQLKTMQ